MKMNAKDERKGGSVKRSYSFVLQFLVSVLRSPVLRAAYTEAELVQAAEDRGLKREIALKVVAEAMREVSNG